MSKIKKNLYFYSLPLLSGLLMAVSYIPFPPYLLFFCYIPLWVFALRQKKIKSLFIGAWLCQFVATLLGFHWLAYTFREFGFFSWPLSILGLLGFASFANLHIPIALILWFWSQKILSKLEVNKFFSFILLPLYSVLVMKYYPMIFEWHWGYSWFYAGWPAIQTAEIWGFQFLNTLTLFFNYLGLCGGYYYFSRSRKKAFLVWGGGLLLFTLLNIQGLYLKHRWPEPNKTARVLIIQPNIKNLHWQFRKSKKDPRKLALNQLFKETGQFFKEGTFINKQGELRPDFILWPEGAYPYRINHNKEVASRSFVSQKASEWQTPILLSATGESPLGVTNSLFAFNQKGQLMQPPYDKVWLLAFGEYLPGEKWFNWSKWLSYYGRSFKRGTGEYKTIDIKNYRLGLQICYESLFDFWTRDLVREGVDILVNVTNDSWYGRGFEPYQHLYMTLARSIEVRRPLVRGTNTGFSAVISAKGDILKKSSLYKEDSWIQKVPYYSQGKQSLWTSWGYYINSFFIWTLMVGVFSYALVRAIKKLLLNVTPL